jgi:hypothetical protein
MAAAPLCVICSLQKVEGLPLVGPPQAACAIFETVLGFVEFTIMSGLIEVFKPWSGLDILFEFSMMFCWHEIKIYGIGF